MRRYRPTDEGSSESETNNVRTPGKRTLPQLVRGRRPARGQRPGRGENRQEEEGPQYAIEGYNAEREGEVTVDPEAPEHAARLVPPGEQWNGSDILSRWSQIDRTADTHTSIDSRRCGPQSVLAIHVMGGPDAVSRVAGAALQAIRHIDDDDARAVAERHRDTLRRIQNEGRLKDGTFSDLDELAETLYVIANRASMFEESGAQGSSTNEEEMGRISDLGAVEGGPVSRSGLAGLADAISPDLGQWVAPELPGTREVQGGQADDDLPSSGSFHGMRAMRSLASRLRYHRNVGFVIGVRAPDFDRDAQQPESPQREDGSLDLDALTGTPHNSIGHGVTFGVDGDGRVYLYDPWPREGDQLIYETDEMRDYFEGDWVIISRTAAASTSARRLGSDQS